MKPAALLTLLPALALLTACGATHPTVAPTAPPPVRAPVQPATPAPPQPPPNPGTPVGLPHFSPQDDWDETMPTRVVFRPDGALLATAHASGRVQVFSAATGELRGVLWGHHAAPAVAWSGDGATLATGGAEGALRFWDAAHFSLARTVWTACGGITDVAFAPGGAQVAVGCADGTVRLWDAHAFTAGAVLRGPRGEVRGLTYRGDGGEVAAIGAGGRVSAWNARSGALVRSLVAREARALHYEPDGAHLLVATTRGVTRWEPSTGRSTQPGGDAGKGELEGDEPIAFSPDGSRLALSTFDSVAVRSVADGADLPFEPPDPGEQGMGSSSDNDVVTAAWSPDGSALAIVRRALPMEISPLRDAETATRMIDAGSEYGSVSTLAAACAWSPDGSTVAVVPRRASRVWLWDAHTGEARGVDLPGELRGENQGAMFSADGAWVLAGKRRAATSPAGVNPEDVEGGNEEEEYSNDDHAVGNPAVWAADAGSSVQVLGTVDGRQGALVYRLPGPQAIGIVLARRARGAIQRLALAPDGRTLAAAGDDGTIELWTLPARRSFATLRADAHGVWDLAFSPDGATLLAGGDDGTVRLWDVRTRHARGAWDSGAPLVLGVAWSADGARIAVAGSNGHVTVWDAGTHARAASYDVLAQQLAFSPDGHYLLGAGAGATLVRLADGDVLYLRPLDGALVAHTVDGAYEGELPPAGAMFWLAAGTPDATQLAGSALAPSFTRPNLVADFLAGRATDVPEALRGGVGLPPRVTIVEPAEDTVRAGRVRVRVRARDAGGGLSEIVLESPGGPDGPARVVRAVATEAAGAEREEVFDVTVADDGSPTVSVTASARNRLGRISTTVTRTLLVEPGEDDGGAAGDGGVAGDGGGVGNVASE